MNLMYEAEIINEVMYLFTKKIIVTVNNNCFSIGVHFDYIFYQGNTTLLLAH